MAKALRDGRASAKSATAKAKSAKAAEQLGKQLRHAATLLKQVSDPTRIQIVLMLAEEETNVGDISARVNQSQPATSHHLALLRHGGLIAARREGKNNFYSLTELGEELAELVRHLVP